MKLIEERYDALRAEQQQANPKSNAQMLNDAATARPESKGQRAGRNRHPYAKTPIGCIRDPLPIQPSTDTVNRIKVSSNTKRKPRNGDTALRKATALEAEAQVRGLASPSHIAC